MIISLDEVFGLNYKKDTSFLNSLLGLAVGLFEDLNFT